MSKIFVQDRATGACASFPETKQGNKGVTVSKKRGSGCNKTRKKQREYKAHCRAMRTSGHVCDANGVWTTNYKSLGISDASFRGTTAK